MRDIRPKGWIYDRFTNSYNWFGPGPEPESIDYDPDVHLAESQYWENLFARENEESS